MFNKVIVMVCYYIYGIFVGVKYFFYKMVSKKYNFLQCFVYVILLVMVLLLIWGLGFFYLFYVYWKDIGLEWIILFEWVVLVYIVGVFMMLMFFIVYVYLMIMGYMFFVYIWIMIIGWEDVEEVKMIVGEV